MEKNPDVCSSLKPFFSANIGIVKKSTQAIYRHEALSTLYAGVTQIKTAQGLK
jgi:hypothetical protein